MTRTAPPQRTTRVVGTRAVVVLGLALLAVALLPAGAADAAAYRYWGYYQLNGTTWQFATTGPDQTTPADGSVEGWRFAVGTEDSTRFPRATPTFDDICGKTAAKAGDKRVAVVIDYGRTADSADDAEPPAPVGRCAVVNSAATGLEVLSDVASVRSQKALICGIDGFPATGCGDAVASVSTAAKAPDTPVTLKIAGTHGKETSGSSHGSKADETSHTGTYVGIGVAVLAVLAVGGVALRRRRTAA